MEPMHCLLQPTYGSDTWGFPIRLGKFVKLGKPWNKAEMSKRQFCFNWAIVE